MKQYKIICTEHAADRMKERGVSRVQVEKAITNPHIVLDTLDPKRKRHRLQISKRQTIDVIFEPRKGKKYIIVTVAVLERDD